MKIFMKHDTELGIFSFRPIHDESSAQELSTDWQEITIDKHNELIHGQNMMNQIIYLDENNEPQLRDWSTKYDETTNSWIPDNDLLAENKRQIFKSQSQQKLNETACYDMPSYRLRFTDEQNNLNDLYRAQLWNIIEGNYNGTELPINPNIKE